MISRRQGILAYEWLRIYYDMSCLLQSTLGGYKMFTLGGRDTLRKVGPHDIKRSLMLTLDRKFIYYVMGMYLGLLHPVTLHKTNPDNLCMLNPNF
jgi:hypothetical protein